jgi:hypothetical protein
MAKSELFTACLPSFPEMPTPMWASWIMPTSFAPSPIAKVTGLVVSFRRTRPTINRFCAGDTRHATTALQTFANFKKRCSSSSFPRIVSIAVAPSTTNARWSDASEAGVRCGSSSKGSRSVDSCSDDLAETAAGSGVAALCTTASSAVSCAPKPQSPSGPFVAPSACANTRVTRSLSTWCVDGVTVAATAKAQNKDAAHGPAA